MTTDPSERCTEPRFVLMNRTARRIALRRDGALPLVIVPFGTACANTIGLDKAEVQRWVDQGFLKRSEARPHESSLPPSYVAALLMAFVVCLLVGLVARNVPIIVAGLIPILYSLVPYLYGVIQNWRKQRDLPLIRDEVWRGVGMLLVACTGFGVPLSALYLQTGKSITQFAHLDLRCLWSLGMFALFVGSAATLPAMLFFLFAEQRRTIVKEQFCRDVLRLDPSLRTLDDVEQVYSPLVTDVLGVRKGPLFFAPVILSTFLLALGWVAATLPTVEAVSHLMNVAPGQPRVAFHSMFTPNRTAFTFAFFGTYFFSINMIFRRYVRADLGPKAYSHIAVRIIIATVLSWVVSQDFPPTGSSPPDLSFALTCAFIIGFLPETSLAIFQDLLKNKTLGKIISTLDERQPLSMLEGITLYDRARLLEEGIENVENLAHHNLVDLILRTRIPTARLIDLVDQSILSLHAQDVDSDSSTLLRTLKSYGIRTATDLVRVISRGCDFSGTGLSEHAKRITLLKVALEDDEWMSQLMSWVNYRQSHHRTYGLEDFELLNAAKKPKMAAVGSALVCREPDATAGDPSAVF